MKKAESDFTEIYFQEGKRLLQSFFEKYPNDTLSTGWGQGKWWMFKRNDCYEFHINEDWLKRDAYERMCSFPSLDDSCEPIKELVEFNMWNQYIGKDQPGWSLRWLSAVKSACGKCNIF